MSDPEEEESGSQRTSRPDERQGVIVVGAGPTGQDVVGRVVHVMPVTLVDKGMDGSELGDGAKGARFLQGDATSKLVLDQAGVDEAYALIATTKDDAVNIETSRLAVEAGVPEVLCALRDPNRATEAAAVGARPVFASEAMASAIVSRIPGVVVTTSQVGLGQGDILQVRVLPGSPVVGNEIKDVATREYLVAAIYREGALVVPHGDTVIEPGDQVLLVGDPTTLGAVAAYFRLGGAQFPHQFGQAVVIWADGEAGGLLDEARWIREVTKTSGLLRVAPPDAPSATAEPWTVHLAAPPRGDGGATAKALAPVLEARPGLFVVAPPRRSLFREQGMGPLRSLLDVADAPVLVGRNTQPYRKILVAVSNSASSWRGLELAFDIARLFGAKVTAAHVSPPRFIGGDRAAEKATHIEERVHDLGRLFEVDIEYVLAEGNPVREIERLSKDHQLLVVARGRSQSDTYLQPDVGLRMVLGVDCSALIVTRD